MKMGSSFLSQDRFARLTFFLVSFTIGVCFSLPTNVSDTTAMVYETTDGNATGQSINHTVIHGQSVESDHELSSPNDATQSSMGSTNLILIIGCIVSIAFLSVVVLAIFRFQVRKKAEYQRAAKAQVSSTRNAGVYMDLAMDNPISKSSLPINVPIYNSMKKRPDQYTFISDDELDL